MTIVPSVEERASHHQVVENEVLSAMGKPRFAYWAALFLCVGGFAMMLALWGYQIMKGMGVTGLNNPVGWAVYITNFVFWVGIAHSGTLISAILYLFRARFRSAFNRPAEAMTVFAVMTAAMFPLIHLGRVWFFFWLVPYPNQRLLWVNFRSPLMWDVFAVSTYFTISVVFFYAGMIPDLAIAKRFHGGMRKRIYSVLSLGWVGSFRQWKHYTKLYMFLAAFATPLVVSVHSVVSWDFAMSILPGWHTTIFAPYFVAGAIFSGTAMVITLVVPMRKFLGLQRHITIDHFENIAKILLFTSLLVTYSYIVEFGLALYSGNVYEKGTFLYRLTGDYRYLFWTMLFCNSIVPLILLVRKWRRNLAILFGLSIFVNIGMWLERFVIIVTSMAKDFDPYSWGLYKPHLIELGIMLGSFGFFFAAFLIFTKVFPVIAVTELKEVGDG